ncbi:hypothetical protein [Algibacter luteus]|uniref:Uncharacterized protein n=1 Tax=Algibacter luteus TaxID=1178825 RepID=A0A1M6EMY0_9FLAO|nr:hypothetical protein [Algibacter luteus]SHI86804.1 hypothetical protein SAMN05216261_2060 [Algibacter luteus]
MIKVKNKFNESNLEINFSRDTQSIKDITIHTSNDVNFKELIDYLLEIITEKENLEIEYDDFEDQENVEKLELIKGTINEIYEKFNASIVINSEVNVTDDETEEQNDDLPF